MTTAIVALIAFVAGVVADHFLENKVRSRISEALKTAGAGVSNASTTIAPKQ